jgi:hypothetical protein
MIIFSVDDLIDNMRATVRHDVGRRSYVVTLRDLDSMQLAGSKTFDYQSPESSPFDRRESFRLAIAHAQHLCTPVFDQEPVHV